MMLKRLLLTSLIIISLASAQFQWQDNGIAFRQGVHIEWQRTVSSGQDGTAIIIWSDVRYGIRDIYAQKIDTTGSLLWGLEGLAVTNSPGRQEDPVAIADGNGGVFISWVDYRNGDMSDIYIQHLDAGGNLLMDADGVALCTADSVQISISMCTDNSGGAYIVWQDKRNGVDEDIYGTHIDANHNIVAAGEAVAIAYGSGAQKEKSIEYAGNNQALLVWKDAYSNNTNIYGQRLNLDMSFHWTEHLGIAHEDYLESRPRTTYMRNDTNLVVWQETDGSDRVRYQLVNADGLVLAGPQILTDDPGVQTGPRVKRDPSGNVFVMWKDFRHDPIDGRFYTQKVNPAGEFDWSLDGVPLDVSSTKNDNARLTVDGDGGIWCAWEEGVYPDIRINLQHVSAAGDLMLSDTGNISYDLFGFQFSPILVSDNNGGAFIFAGDQKSGSIDLISQRVDASGALDFTTTGLIIMPGMDGDVAFVDGLEYDDQSAFLLWEDGRSEKHTYGMVIDTTGRRADNFNLVNGVDLMSFDLHSEAVISEPAYLYNNGDLFVGSYDISGGSKSLRINKLNTQFQNLWDSNGVTVYPSIADQLYTNLVPLNDGLGVIWSEIRNFMDYDIYYQRFDNSGSPILAPEGITLASVAFKNGYTQAVIPAANGDFVMIWMEDAWHAQDLFAQRYTADGVIAAGWPQTPVPVCVAVDDQRNAIAIAINDTDGIFIAWEDLRSGTVDLYGQILSWDGNLSWAENGLPITTADNDQLNSVMSYDHDYNRALVVWEDFRGGMDYDIYGQFIDFNSQALVDTNIVFCNELLYQQNPAVANVYPGTFLVTWEDERGSFNPDPIRTGGMDVYGQLYQIGLGIRYAAGGLPIIREFHDQLDPQIVKVFAAGAPEDDRWLVYWRDLRSSGKADIAGLYGQLIKVTDALSTSFSGVIPTEFKVHPAYPNPFNGVVTFGIDLPNAQPITLVIYNVLGQSVYQEKILPLRNGYLEITWEGRNQFYEPLPSGLYLYSLKAGEHFSTGKITFLK